MIKLPEYLQDKIYNLMIKNKQLKIKTTIEDVLKLYQDDFKRTRLTNAEIIKNIKTIKTWRTNPTKKRKMKEILNNEELIKQQQNELEELKKEVKILKNNKTEANSELIATKSKVKAYEEAMYLQKKTRNLFENIKTKITLNGEEYKIDIFESYLLQLLNKAKKETENDRRPEFGRLLCDILRENEKAMLFLQQQNINTSSNVNSEEVNKILKELNNNEDIKEVKNINK